MQVGLMLPRTGPIVTTVDATQLPCTDRQVPECGWVVAPRTQEWRRGIHLARRFVGLSALPPRSARGDSRAGAPALVAVAHGHDDALRGAPEQTESVGGHPAAASARGWRLQWHGVLRALSARVVLFARCAKNRALFALPTYRPGEGWLRRQGDRGSSPQATLHTTDGRQAYQLMMRNRVVTVTVKLTSPRMVRCPLCSRACSSSCAGSVGAKAPPASRTRSSTSSRSPRQPTTRRRWRCLCWRG